MSGVNGSIPHFLCAFCGDTYGRLPVRENAAWEQGECECCGDEEVLVTRVTNYGGVLDTWRDGREFQ